ncbi:MAG: hypothetical protein K2X47_20450 [Bdellovibrionales bacterium]|nr:hypothetical protein [Bdellovibrionales bacterium]
MQYRIWFAAVGLILMASGIAFFQNCGATFKAQSQSGQSAPASADPGATPQLTLKDELGELLSLPELTVKAFVLPTPKDDNGPMRIASFIENCQANDEALSNRNIFRLNKSKISAYYNVNFLLREQLRFATSPNSQESISSWNPYQISAIIDFNYKTTYLESIKKILSDGLPVRIRGNDIVTDIKKITNGIEIHVVQNAPVTGALVYDTVLSIETSSNRVMVKKNQDHYFPPTVKDIVSTATFDYDLRCLEMDGTTQSTSFGTLPDTSDDRIYRDHRVLKLEADVLQGYVAGVYQGGEPQQTPAYNKQSMDLKTWKVTFESGQLYSVAKGEFTVNGQTYRPIGETVQKVVRTLNTQTKCYDLSPSPGTIIYAKEDSLPGVLRTDAETCKRIRAGENLTFTPQYSEGLGIQNCDSAYDAYLAALEFYKDRTVEPKLINMPACPIQLD